jgi:hypothetical protein
MNTLKWIGVGLVTLFGVTVAMLVRSGSSKGSGLTPAGPGMDLGEAERLTPDWTDDDFNSLAEVAKRRRMSVADLGLVLASESGLKPNAVNRNSDGFPVAVGLPQFTSAANKSIGLSEEERQDVPNWSVSRQIPLIDRQYSNIGWSLAGKSYDHAGVIYAANAAPSRLMSRGSSPDVVLYDKEDDPAAYAGNRGFDTTGKGYITIGDLIDHLKIVANQPVYRAWLSRLQSVLGDASLAPRLPM